MGRNHLARSRDFFTRFICVDVMIFGYDAILRVGGEQRNKNIVE